MELSALLNLLIEKRGGDLHIAPGLAPMMRVQGQLEPVDSERLDEVEAEALLITPLEPPHRAELARSSELAFSFVFSDRARIRATYVRSASGLSASFRVLSSRVSSLAELGCPTATATCLAEVGRGGLFLVSGARGSGTTHTLACFARHIAEEHAAHVVSFEQPHELAGRSGSGLIVQREIGHDAPDILTALESAGSESADAIVIPDLPPGAATARALDLARAGVLVIASLRARSIEAAIDRLTWGLIGTEHPDALAGTLIAALGQVLVPLASGSGVVAAFELLLGSEELDEILRLGETERISPMIAAGAAAGMQTLEASLAQLTAKGRVREAASRPHVRDLEHFARCLRRGM